jgi:hypothetical protein
MARIPQPVVIAACLTIGLGLGLAFPRNPIVLAIAQSGTWFPRTVVTLATAIVFILMSAALARTLLTIPGDSDHAVPGHGRRVVDLRLGVDSAPDRASV